VSLEQVGMSGEIRW